MPLIRPNNSRIKCKYCNWQIQAWKTNKKGKRINNYSKLRQHVGIAHPEIIEKLENEDEYLKNWETLCKPNKITLSEFKKLNPKMKKKLIQDGINAMEKIKVAYTKAMATINNKGVQMGNGKKVGYSVGDKVEVKPKRVASKRKFKQRC